MREVNSLDRVQDMRLRVMSYNIHSGIGMDNRYDLNRIAEEISDSGSEVVGLQEADVHWGSRSAFQDSIRLLAEKLKMHAFFAPIYQLAPLAEGQPDRKFGVAVLSRYPMLHAVNHPMSRLSTQDKDRPDPMPMPGFAETEIDVNGIRLRVYVAHLDYRSDPAVRIVQVREIMDILSQNGDNKLLLGDFNACPDAAELSPLFQLMKDSWAEAGSSDNGFTFPADRPDRKIDYILTSRDIHTVSSQILNTSGSDHRPVVADVLLHKRSGA